MRISLSEKLRFKVAGFSYSARYFLRLHRTGFCNSLTTETKRWEMKWWMFSKLHAFSLFHFPRFSAHKFSFESVCWFLSRFTSVAGLTTSSLGKLKLFFKTEIAVNVFYKENLFLLNVERKFIFVETIFGCVCWRNPEPLRWFLSMASIAPTLRTKKTKECLIFCLFEFD